MIKLTSDKLVSGDIHFLPQNMSTIQRILLSSDGTMTNLLEELLREELIANKLFEEIKESVTDVPRLAITKGQKLWRRIITLQGKRSGVNYLHAESLIAPDNIDREFADKLINTSTPIGKIWELFKVETYKSLVSWGIEPAATLAEYFNIQPDKCLLYRTYQVFSQRRPVMQVTEKFPSEWFNGYGAVENVAVGQV